MTSSPIIFTTRPAVGGHRRRRRAARTRSTIAASSSSPTCWLRAVNPTRSANPTTPSWPWPVSAIDRRRRIAACRCRRQVAVEHARHDGQQGAGAHDDLLVGQLGVGQRPGPAARAADPGADDVDLRRGDAGHRRADDPAHLQHQVASTPRRRPSAARPRSGSRRPPSVKATSLVARHRVAERAPQLARPCRRRGRCGPTRPPGRSSATSGTISRSTASSGSVPSRSAASSSSTRAAQIGEHLPDRPHRVVAQRRGVERRERRSSERAALVGGGAGSDAATATGGACAERRRRPPGRSAAAEPDRAAPRPAGRWSTTTGRAPGAVSRTAGTPGWGSSSHSSASRSPCQRTA